MDNGIVGKWTKMAMRNAYMVLRMRPLGRYRRRWEDNIEFPLMERGVSAWIGFMWLREETSD